MSKTETTCSLCENDLDDDQCMACYLIQDKPQMTRTTPDITETTPKADDIIRLVNANESEAKSIRELFCLVRHGYKSIDIKVRKDAKETWFQADWLARLARLEGKS